MSEYDDFKWEGGNPLFGDWGRSPRAESATFLGTPVGVPCLHCEQLVRMGDTGEYMRSFGVEETIVVPVHRECLLLHVVGHAYGYCHCTEYQGLTEREAALEVARLVDSGVIPE